MDQDNEKIPSPFQAPEGYFESFDARLEARLGPNRHKTNPPMQVEQGGRPWMEWTAVAATATILLVTGVMFWQKIAEPEIATPPVAVEKPKPVLKEIPKAAAVDPVAIENAIVEAILEDSETPATQVVPERKMSKKEMATALELEEAGLIVLDAEDGLFDQFEL